MPVTIISINQVCIFNTVPLQAKTFPLDDNKVTIPQLKEK